MCLFVQVCIIALIEAHLHLFCDVSGVCHHILVGNK